MPFCIKDGQTSNRATVSPVNSLVVGDQYLPAAQQNVEALTSRRLLRSFFQTAAGSPNLNVDGSVTPVEFAVPFRPSTIQFITGVRFVFNDETMNLNTAAELRRFGSAAVAPGLTNGLLFTAIQESQIIQLFNPAVQNIAGFFNSTDKATNYANGIAAGVDYLSFDFILSPAVVLIETNKLTITVRDNLTAVNLFQVYVIGWQEDFGL